MKPTLLDALARAEKRARTSWICTVAGCGLMLAALLAALIA